MPSVAMELRNRLSIPVFQDEYAQTLIYRLHQFDRVAKRIADIGVTKPIKRFTPNDWSVRRDGSSNPPGRIRRSPMVSRYVTARRLVGKTLPPDPSTPTPNRSHAHWSAA